MNFGTLSGFVGRNWALKRIEDWRATPSQLLLISGRPGTGKSALASELIRIHHAVAHSSGLASKDTVAAAWVSAAHICQAARYTSRDPTWFAQLVSAQLAEAFEDFDSARDRVLSDLSATPITISGTASADVVAGVNVGALVTLPGLSALETADRLLRRPLQFMSANEPAPIVLVDALDETLGFQGSASIIQVVKSLLSESPLRWVITTRPDPRIMDSLGPAATSFDLTDDAPEDTDDIGVYINSRLNEGDVRTTNLAIRIAEAAVGNFLYARFVVDNLRRDASLLQQALNAPSKFPLPGDLAQLYGQFLNRELRDPATPAAEQQWREIYRPLLTTLAACFEPGLTAEQLADVLPGSPDLAAVRDSLRTCGQFLDKPDVQGRQRLYHQSFRDYLLTGPERVAESAEVHANLAERLATNWQGEWQHADDYGSAHTVAHYALGLSQSNLPRHQETRLRSQLTNLLVDFNYLYFKTQRSGFDSVLTDLSLAEPLFRGQAGPLPTLFRTLRVSARAVARDPRQLSGQIVGRLNQAQDPDLRGLARQALSGTPGPWLQPMLGSLMPPTGFIQLLGTHKGVISARTLNDSTGAITVSRHGNIKTWRFGVSEEAASVDLGYSLLDASMAYDNSRTVLASVGAPRPEAPPRIQFSFSDGQPSHGVEEPPESLNRIVALPNGFVAGLTLEQASTGEVSTTLRVWHAESGQLKGAMTLPFAALHFDGCAASQSVAASYSGMVMTWGPLFECEPFVVPHAIWRLRIAPDGLKVVIAAAPRIGINEGHYDDLRRMFRSEQDTVFIEDLDMFGDNDASPQEPDEDPRYHASIWDLRDGKLLHKLLGHTARIDALDISSDGQMIVTGSADRSIKVWEAGTGKLIGSYFGHEGSVHEVSITPDSRHVVSTGSEGLVKLWELPSRDVAKESTPSTTLNARELSSRHATSVLKVVAATESPLAVTGGADGKIMTWDCARGDLQRIFDIDSSPVTALSQLRNDEECLFGTGSGMVGILNVRTGAHIAFAEGHEKEVTDVAFLDAETAISSSLDKSLLLWELRKRRVCRTLRDTYVPAFGSTPFLALFPTASGSSVISLSYEYQRDFGKGMRTLNLWDVAESRAPRKIDSVFAYRPYIEDARVLPLAASLLSAVGYGNELKIWDLNTLEETASLRCDSIAMLVTVTVDESQAVIALEDGSIILWDLRTGDGERVLGQHSNKVTTLSVSPDGNYLCSGDDSGEARVWDIQASECVAGFTADAALTCSIVLRDESFILGDSTGAVHLLRLRLP